MNPVEGFRLVAFDLDGVLVNSFRCWWELLSETLIGQGKPPLSEAEFAASWGQDVEADRRRFFPEWTLEQLHRHYAKEFPRFADRVKAQPGARDVLAGLKKRGKKLAVATNSPLHIAVRLLDRASLAEFLDWTAAIDLVAHGKPEPDLLEYVAKRSGVGSKEMCYVGDTEFDAGASSAAGVYFIGYKRPGDRRIESLRELIA